MDRATFEPFAALLRSIGPTTDRMLDQLRDLMQVQSFDVDAWLLRGGEIATIVLLDRAWPDA